MIYLDYASTTPMDSEVSENFLKVQQIFFANPDSLHPLGMQASQLMQDALQQMANLLQVEATELIMTSGATEANNLAILGGVGAYPQRGKHIITTNIEHASVQRVLAQLATQGYEITYIPVDTMGVVAVADVYRAVRPDTLLISIMHINNEIGTIQPIVEIADKVKKRYPQVILHSDMAQSIGKVKIDLTHIDIATFSGHKFYAPKSVGILYKKNAINVKPILYGGQQQNSIRPGTSNVAIIAATAQAMRKAFDRLHNEKEQQHIRNLQTYLVQKLQTLPHIIITGPFGHSTPYFVHFRIVDTKVEIETFMNALSQQGICISTRSTCHSKALHEANPVLQAIGCSAEESRKGIRISLSHLTTMAELQQFILVLEQIIQQVCVI